MRPWQATASLLLFLLVLPAAATGAATANAGAPLPGEALPPGATHRNGSGATEYLVLALAPADSFTNGTDADFRVLSPRQLRALADAVADPQVLAHEEAILRLKTRLADLDAALATVGAERDGLREASP